MFQEMAIEAVTQKCFLKEELLKISLTSGENACVRVSFLIKLQPPDCNFNKKKTQTRVFFCEFYEIFKNTNFVENLQKTASVTRFGS